MASASPCMIMRTESPMASLELLKRQRDLLIKTIGADKPAEPAAIEALNKINRAIGYLSHKFDRITAKYFIHKFL